MRQELCLFFPSCFQTTELFLVIIVQGHQIYPNLAKMAESGPKFPNFQNGRKLAKISQEWPNLAKHVAINGKHDLGVRPGMGRAQPHPPLIISTRQNLPRGPKAQAGLLYSALLTHTFVDEMAPCFILFKLTILCLVGIGTTQVILQGAGSTLAYDLYTNAALAYSFT